MRSTCLLIAKLKPSGKRAVFVEESDGEGAARDPREAEVDAFAQECLIPAGDYERFCLNGDFSLAAIRR